MRIFKVKTFARWAKSERVTDAELAQAVSEIEAGLIDADLGGGLVKKRVARKGQGKSGGFRTILAFKTGANAFFLEGFAKNEKDNISATAEKALKAFAKELMGLSDEGLKLAIGYGELTEIDNE